MWLMNRQLDLTLMLLPRCELNQPRQLGGVICNVTQQGRFGASLIDRVT